MSPNPQTHLTWMTSLGVKALKAPVNYNAQTLHGTAIYADQARGGARGVNGAV